MTFATKPATGRNETTDNRIAAAAFACGYKLERIERRFNVPVFQFTDDDKRLSATTIGEIGASYLASNPDIERQGGAMTDALKLFYSEEHRRSRQGATAPTEPAYSKDELKSLSRAQTALELPSVNAAMSAGRVSGIGKPAGESQPVEYLYTRSQLLAMSPQTYGKQLATINQALTDGLVNMSA